MPTLTLVQKLAVWIIPVLLAITLHEAAHAWVAYRCGDPTAKRLGRLSINPLRHIDLIGTLLVPIVIAVLTQFQYTFGWAKPVPINSSNFHKPRRDTALTAAAGPVSNLFMAFLWSIVLKISTLLHPETSVIALYLLLTAQAGLLINLLLGYFNLFPIPPLDGSKVFASLLSTRQAAQYQKLEPYGFFIVIALVATNVIFWILNPLLSWSLHFIYIIFNL